MNNTTKNERPNDLIAPEPIKKIKTEIFVNVCLKLPKKNSSTSTKSNK